MQCCVASAGSPMTSGVAIHEGNAAELAEIDTTLSRTIDRPAPQRPAVPTRPLRERLRRPLLILFPILLANRGLPRSTT